VDQLLQNGSLPLSVARVHSPQCVQNGSAKLDLALLFWPRQDSFSGVQVDQVVHDVDEKVMVWMQDLLVVKEHLFQLWNGRGIRLENLNCPSIQSPEHA